MSSPPAGIPEADWLATPASVRTLILVQQQEIQALRQENDELRSQLTSLATELASVRERIGRSSSNSSKPPSSDGPGFKPPERRKGSGRKRGGQPGHPGSGPELLPIERVDEVVDHHPDACRRCGTLLHGEDPDPLRHQVIEIPPIAPVVIEHLLHRLVCPCCSTSTCATLPAEVEASPYGPRLSALVGLLGSAFPLSFSKTQALLNQLLGVEISRGAIATIRERISTTLEVGYQRGERTPWDKTVRTCQQILQVADALWTFLETCGIEPTNNAAERALRQSVIQRKISHGVQSRQGAICRSRLLTVTTSLRQQGRDVWQFLEQAWITHHSGGVMPSLLPDP